MIKMRLSLRAIQIEVKKVYPAYVDRYNHEAYKDINVAIEKLCVEEFVFAEKNSAGQYSKVRLNIAGVSEYYRKLKRTSIPEQCEKVKKSLAEYRNSESQIVQAVIKDWCQCLEEYKKLPYDLKYDGKRGRSRDNSNIASGIKLNSETYIRNFSTALFKDSKRFQKEFCGTVETILFDYTDEVVEKMIFLDFIIYMKIQHNNGKGNVVIQLDTSVIDVSEMPDGIALSNASLLKKSGLLR